MSPRKTSSELKTITQEDGFRRMDDIERLAKLEYVVYEDHETMIQALNTDVKLISTTQQEIKNYLKNIKNILIAFLIGLAASQIGWANLAKIAIAL